MFSNYKRMKITLPSYLKACDLWDVIEEKSMNDLPRRIREKKEEKTLEVLKKAIHPEIWKLVRDSSSPNHVWKMIECVVSKHESEFLPEEYWVQCFEEDEYIKEESDFEDTLMENQEEHHLDEVKEVEKIKVEVQETREDDENDEVEKTTQEIEEKEFVKHGEEIKDPYVVKDVKVESYVVTMENTFAIKHESEGHLVENHVQGNLFLENFTNCYLQLGVENILSDTGWVNMEEFFGSRESPQGKFKKCEKFKKNECKCRNEKKTMNKLKIMYDHVQIDHKPYTAKEMALTILAIEGGGTQVQEVSNNFMKPLNHEEICKIRTWMCKIKFKRGC